MKAIRVHKVGDPEVMRLEEVPDLQPGAGQVVVRVKAAGVNPVDTYIRSGLYPRKPAFPYTPGNDAGGVVESIGTGVTRVVSRDLAWNTCKSVHGPWRLSRSPPLAYALPGGYFDRLGVPRLYHRSCR